MEALRSYLMPNGKRKITRDVTVDVEGLPVVLVAEAWWKIHQALAHPTVKSVKATLHIEY